MHYTTKLLLKKSNTIEFKLMNIKKKHEILDLFKFNKLELLDCSKNYISGLINLPNTLVKLDCSFNNINVLEQIPNSLIELFL